MEVLVYSINSTIVISTTYCLSFLITSKCAKANWVKSLANYFKSIDFILVSLG